MSIIDTGKTFDKHEHPFLIKPLNKLGVEEADISIIKAVHGNL